MRTGNSFPDTNVLNSEETYVLRSMWDAVATGSTDVRALRQTGARTDGISSQSCTGTRPAGWHSLDGLLRADRRWRCGGGRCRQHHLPTQLPDANTRNQEPGSPPTYIYCGPA